MGKRFERFAAALVSGCCVYVVMAACSSGGIDTKQIVNVTGDAAPNHPSGGMSNGGVSSAAGTSALMDAAAGLADVILSPVDAATAQQPEDTVISVACTKNFSTDTDAYSYAEATFDGVSMGELANLRAYITRRTTAEFAYNGTPAPTGYTNQIVQPFIANAKAAVVCGEYPVPPGVVNRVTFVLPAR